MPARNACCSLLLLGLACCGTQHINLVARGTASAGNAKNCATGEASNNCTDTTTDVPADQNQGGTAFIKLPAECGGRIHRIVVHDVSSKAPVAYVECAAKENPISETRPAAATGR